MEKERSLQMFVVLIIFGLISVVKSAENGTDGDDIGTEELIRLGRKLHKPMLTLIGMAIRNLHKCDQWSEWSPCGAMRKGYFSNQERSRTCFIDDDVRDENETVSSDIEYDYKICEGNCHKDYNITTNGYCMKLFQQVVKNFSEAQETCENDGGHLIRIDTSKEYADVVSLLKKYNSRVFIGGRRQSVNTEWDFDPVVVPWHSGEPSSRSDELCMYLHEDDRKKADIECENKYAFVCEIDN